MPFVHIFTSHLWLVLDMPQLTTYAERANTHSNRHFDFQTGVKNYSVFIMSHFTKKVFLG